MSGKMLLTLNETLLKQLDEEKEQRGGSRNGTVVRILEQYFQEELEKRQIREEWFMAEVKRGLDSLRNDPLYDHDDVMQDADAILEGKRRKHAPEVV